MATGYQTEQRRESFASLASGIIDDVQDLLKQELKLARHEIKGDLEDAKAAGVYLGIASGAMLIGAFVTALGVAQLLAWMGMPLWAGSMIVGVVLLAVGAAVLVKAKSKAEDLGPERTVQTVKENVRWIKKHS